MDLGFQNLRNEFTWLYNRMICEVKPAIVKIDLKGPQKGPISTLD